MGPPIINIALHSGNPREQEAERLLLHLLAGHDVERWLFTRQVIIRSGVQPHSHPVLTLNTRQIDEPDGFLGTFLHEQFHWAAEARRDQVKTAIEELRALFPTVPVGPPEGARDESSSYLHLIINTWELDALSLLLGEARARNVIARRGYYTWIYQQTLDDDGALRELIMRHGLALSEL